MGICVQWEESGSDRASLVFVYLLLSSAAYLSGNLSSAFKSWEAVSIDWKNLNQGGDLGVAPWTWYSKTSLWCMLSLVLICDKSFLSKNLHAQAQSHLAVWEERRHVVTGCWENKALEEKCDISWSGLFSWHRAISTLGQRSQCRKCWYYLEADSQGQATRKLAFLTSCRHVSCLSSIMLRFFLGLLCIIQMINCDWGKQSTGWEEVLHTKQL